VSKTDREADRQTDGNIMPIVDHTACQYDRLKHTKLTLMKRNNRTVAVASLRWVLEKQASDSSDQSSRSVSTVSKDHLVSTLHLTLVVAASHNNTIVLLASALMINHLLYKYKCTMDQEL